MEIAPGLSLTKYFSFLQYYLKTGTCRYGLTCRYHHPPNRNNGAPLLLNNLGLPMRKVTSPILSFFILYYQFRILSLIVKLILVIGRVLNYAISQDEKPCSHYVRTGTCKFGVLCKFHHPQPGSVGNPFTRPPVYGPSGLAFIPYAGGVPKSSEFTVPEITYASNALQVHQAYMPVLLSPSRGWSTYMVSNSFCQTFWFEKLL